MVLVSKLRGPCTATDKQAGNASSFFGKLRSTFGRSSSSPALVGAPSALTQARQGSCRTEDPTKGSKLVEVRQAMSMVEHFGDDSPSSTLAGKTSPAGNSSGSNARPGSCMVILSDFELEEGMDASTASGSNSCQDNLQPFSICGSACDENSSSTSEQAPPQQGESNLDLSLPGGNAQSLLNSAPQAVGQSELPGRLWDPADPPAKANSAWQAPRSSSKEARGPRFPSRLPPLSGLPSIASLSTSKLRECCRKATPITEVSFLPETA